MEGVRTLNFDEILESNNLVRRRDIGDFPLSQFQKKGHVGPGVGLGGLVPTQYCVLIFINRFLISKGYF